MKAYELIDRPDKWCQNAYARNADDRLVPYYDPSATQWCALGAIMRVYGDDCTGTIQKLINRHRVIPEWNDNARWEDVYRELKDLDI